MPRDATELAHRLAREAERLRPKAITLVHNETSTGTTYPAAEVGRIARSVNALYLLDTVSSIAGIDVRTDEWGVDLNMTGSQKCLAAPLGMTLVSVSPAAWDAMERRKQRASSRAVAGSSTVSATFSAKASFAAILASSWPRP